MPMHLALNSDTAIDFMRRRITWSCDQVNSKWERPLATRLAPMRSPSTRRSEPEPRALAHHELVELAGDAGRQVDRRRADLVGHRRLLEAVAPPRLRRVLLEIEREASRERGVGERQVGGVRARAAQPMAAEAALLGGDEGEQA